MFRVSLGEFNAVKHNPAVVLWKTPRLLRTRNHESVDVYINYRNEFTVNTLHYQTTLSSGICNIFEGNRQRHKGKI